MYATNSIGPAFLEEVRLYIERGDLSRISARTAAYHFGLSEGALHHRLRSQGTTFKVLKNAERESRLREAIEDAPASTPDFLAELCGYVKLQSFEAFFTEVTGLRFNEYRRRHGLPRVTIHRQQPGQ